MSFIGTQHVSYVSFLLQFPNNQTRLVPESAAEGVSIKFRLALYYVSQE